MATDTDDVRRPDQLGGTWRAPKMQTSLSASRRTAAPTFKPDLKRSVEDAKRNMNALVVRGQQNLQPVQESWDRSAQKLRQQQHEWEQQLRQQQKRLKQQVDEATFKLGQLSQTQVSLADARRYAAAQGAVLDNRQLPAGQRGPRLALPAAEGMRRTQSAASLTGLQRPGSTQNLETLAREWLEGPRKTIQSCQSTLGNCQDNLQVLSHLMRQNLHLPALRADVQHRAHLGTPKASPKPSAQAAPGSPAARKLSNSSSEGRLRDLQMVATGPEQQEQPSRSLLSDFHVLPGSMRGRELAAIEQVIEDSEAGPQEAEHGLQQPAGPFQEQARKRKRGKGRGGSSLREPGRSVAIVTTAALPWMTGTAVNPLLRAAYLSREGGDSQTAEAGQQEGLQAADVQRQVHQQQRRQQAAPSARPDVTLMIPWLSKADQRAIFPKGQTFETPDEQERYVRDWARKRTGFDSDFKITFYPGRYAAEKGSILPVGDPTSYIPDSQADIAVLEEPEHLNWYHHGRRWTDKFNHVVGIIHTNYLDYARREEGGEAKEKLLRALNSWVCRVHCHKVVKLSDAVQPLPRQTTEFVHGVPEQFLQVGAKKAQPADNGEPRFSRGAYFMGKAVWAKGYTELLALMEQRKREGKEDAELDCYGNGEDLLAVESSAKEKGLNMSFRGAKDHLDESMHEYKVFINPSMSDVVATTTAEALAMGKWVLVHDHPSNKFFTGFDNCLLYKNPEEFNAQLEHALRHDPKPMTLDERKRLTWEDATERFLDVAELKPEERPGPLQNALDTLAWATHNTLTGVEPLRQACGAGINTIKTPAPDQLADWQPTADGGGLFDRRAVQAALAEAAATDSHAAAAAGGQPGTLPVDNGRSRSL